MTQQYEPAVEEIQESLELLTSNVGDGDCGVVRRPFFGVGLRSVTGLRLGKGKHIPENSCL